MGIINIWYYDLYYMKMLNFQTYKIAKGGVRDKIFVTSQPELLLTL